MFSDYSWLVAYGTGALAVFLLFSAVWILSLKKRDVSLVDIFWGLGFVVAAWSFRLVDGGFTTFQLVHLFLVTVWGSRLALHIAWRHQGEDYRYRTMREQVGPSFATRSLFTVFWLQAALVLVIAPPLFFAQSGERPSVWMWTDWIGLGLFALGLFFEAVGDWQLSRFKADPANRGQVLRTGLWALSRHPNYFGDASVWWSFFFFALGTPGGFWTLPSTLLMTVLLLKVSGVALLEKTIVERRPAYRDYLETTSAFIPWFPRRRK